MTIEKAKDYEKMVDEGQLPAIFDESIKILVDGGIDPRDAKVIIAKCQEKFRLKIIPEMIEKALIAEIHSRLDENNFSIEDIESMASKISFEIQRQFVSDQKNEEKTVYKGPGGIELKESSYN
jgi:hypothetical protein